MARSLPSFLSLRSFPAALVSQPQVIFNRSPFHLPPPFRELALVDRRCQTVGPPIRLDMRKNMVVECAILCIKQIYTQLFKIDF